MKYHFDISGEDFSIAGNAALDIKKIFKSHNIPTNVIKRAVIATYEAELNMVVHADGGYIDIEIEPNQIKIIVCDNGPGIPDLQKAMLEGFSTATDLYVQLGYGAGMGLSNIKRNADSLDISTVLDKGTTLTMYFKYDEL